MDIKITKERFSAHWTYDWIKYIVAIIAVIFATSIIYTTTKATLSDVEEFAVLIYIKTADSAKLDRMESDYLEYCVSRSLNSELKNVYIEHINSTNDIYQEQASTTRYMANLQTGGSDVYILENMSTPPSYVIPEGKEEGTWQYPNYYMRSFQTLVTQGYFVDLGTLIEREDLKDTDEVAKLKGYIQSNPELFYTDDIYTVLDADVDTTATKFEGSGKNWGLKINALNVDKNTGLGAIINDGGSDDIDYVVAIKGDTVNAIEAIGFINYLIDNYKIS